MSTVRKGVHYIDRKFPVVGRLNRSLKTKDPRTARHRENIIIRLAELERFDVLQAYIDGKFSVAELSAAVSQGGGAVDKLMKAAGNPALRELVDQFERDKGAEIKTVERYARSLRAVERWSPGIRLEKLASSSALNEFKRARLSAGVKPATVSRDLAAVYQLLVWRGGKSLARDAFDDVRWPAAGRRRTRHLTKDEIRKLLTAAAELRADVHDAFYLILATGLRPSEILRVKSDDVRDGVLFVKDSKTATGVREVPLAPRAAQIIASRGLGKLFRMTPDYLSDVFSRLAKKAGLHDVVLRDLRRTHAQAYRKVEPDIVMIRDQLGHSRVAHTEAYTGHSTAEERRTAVETAGQVMGL